MRIRVKGELTAERLKEALALIGAKGQDLNCYFDGYLIIKAEKDADTSSGTGELNASAIIADGGTDDERPVSEEEWDGPAPAYASGVVDNSPEAIERRRSYEAARELSDRKHAEERAQWDRALTEHKTDVEIFQRLVLRYGDELIGAINKEIEAVWSDVKPVFEHRTKDYAAGASRPMPQLQLLGKTVSFHSFNKDGTTKKILTPLSEKQGYLGACPIWKYPEWRDFAVPRIRAVIDEFAQAAHLVRVNVSVEPASPATP
jgi:hypothetical protein